MQVQLDIYEFFKIQKDIQQVHSPCKNKHFK